MKHGFLIMTAMLSVCLFSCGQKNEPAADNIEVMAAEQGDNKTETALTSAKTTSVTVSETTTTHTTATTVTTTVNLRMPKDGKPSNTVYALNPAVLTVYQEPELPTGCEITALDQTLQYYGFNIDKVSLCDIFLPIDLNGYYNMNQVFLGDPHSESGMGCNAPVIAKSANDYFSYIGSDWKAFDITGAELEEIFWQTEQGRPCVVWSTMYQYESKAEFNFVLGCGEDLWFNPYQHCITVYGFDYNDNTVHIADPLSGNLKVPMDKFRRIYESMGKQAVILYGSKETAGKEFADEKKKTEWLGKNRPDLVTTTSTTTTTTTTAATASQTADSKAAAAKNTVTTAVPKTTAPPPPETEPPAPPEEPVPPEEIPEEPEEIPEEPAEEPEETPEEPEPEE